MLFLITQTSFTWQKIAAKMRISTCLLHTKYLFVDIDKNAQEKKVSFHKVIQFSSDLGNLSLEKLWAGHNRVQTYTNKNWHDL